MIKPIGSYLSQIKWSIVEGIGGYFVTLFAMVGGVMVLGTIFSKFLDSSSANSPFIQLIVLGVLNIPAVSSTLIACNSSNKRFSGIIVNFFIIAFFSFLLLLFFPEFILGPRPTSWHKTFLRDIFVGIHIKMSWISIIAAPITELIFFWFNPISKSEG